MSTSPLQPTVRLTSATSRSRHNRCMFGINGGEFLVLALLAVIVIGPERLPAYARQLREWVIKGRTFVRQGKETLRAEVGEDVDWSQLDPRQYDPRRIVREALMEPEPRPAAATTAPPATPAAPAPFDPDAT